MIHFIVLRREYARVAGWFQWFPAAEATLSDRILAEKFYRGQWDPQREPGQEGHSYSLSPEEVVRVRLWYDYLADVVADEGDRDYAERMDEYLARYA